MSCLFLSLTTYRLNIIVSTTQTLSEIKSQEIIGHIKQHFMTSPLTYVTNDIQHFVKILYKSWVHLDLRADNMLLGGLQPPAPHVTTYEPTTCYLVDYNLQHRMLQPTSRQHATWWTTTSSTACYNLRADNMLFGGLQPPAPHVTTYEPTTCYMVDYILQHRMLQPMSRQHAVWWTTSSSTACYNQEPTTCYMVDYNLQHCMLQPTSRQHAIWWTTTSSTACYNLRADNMLYGRLHPPAPHVTTYEPTTCYLVDYILQHRMLQPTSRQHAIWWTTSSSTACYNLRADNMLFGGLHPPAPHVTTYEPTTCYMVDYILQHCMLQPMSRQHAIWWTTSSSTACYNLRADNMLFGGLHPPALHVTTYEPTTCYLVDYILQHRMLQPMSRQHAIWWTTSSSTACYNL